MVVSFAFIYLQFWEFGIATCRRHPYRVIYLVYCLNTQVLVVNPSKKIHLLAGFFSFHNFILSPPRASSDLLTRVKFISDWGVEPTVGCTFAQFTYPYQCIALSEQYYRYTVSAVGPDSGL